MADERLLKSWKVTEIMLNQASEFLLEPDRFSLPEKEMVEYQNYLAVNELEMAMLELEAVARKHGAKSGFWRRLQKAARQMELEDKVAEYEREFHKALAQHSE
jgi:hypothetical protein